MRIIRKTRGQSDDWSSNLPREFDLPGAPPVLRGRRGWRKRFQAPVLIANADWHALETAATGHVAVTDRGCFAAGSTLGGGAECGPATSDRERRGDY